MKSGVLNGVFGLGSRVRGLLVLTCAGLLVSCTSMMLTPLQNAARSGNAARVKALLDQGADVNEWKYGTALMVAAEKGDLEVVRILIERGADLDMRAQAGYTALGQAALSGHGELVDLLIAKGADIDVAVKGLSSWADFVAGPPYPDAAAAAKIRRAIPVIQSRAGMAYFNAGLYEKAITLYRVKAEANPNDQDNVLILAACYNRMGRAAEAREAAEKAVRLAPDNGAAHLALANAWMLQQNWAAAVASLKTAIRLSPQSAYAHVNLGLALWNLGQHADAIASLRKAAELDPADPTPLNALMYNGAYIGQLDDAIAAAGKLLDMKPDEKADILGFRSLLHREKGMTNEAAQDARDAYAIAPEKGWALFAMGVAALDRKDYEEAIRLFRAMDEKDRGLKTITFETLAHARKGDLKEAEQVFAARGAEAVASKDFLLAPTVAIVIDLLRPAARAHLDQARTLEEAGKFGEALQECVLALRIADATAAGEIRARAAALLQAHAELLDPPEEARKHQVRGALLASEKKMEEALAEYEAAVAAAPCTPAVYSVAARTAAEVKRYDRAVRYMSAYLELSPAAADAREAKDLLHQWEFQLERQAQMP